MWAAKNRKLICSWPVRVSSRQCRIQRNCGHPDQRPVENETGWRFPTHPQSADQREEEPTYEGYRAVSLGSVQRAGDAIQGDEKQELHQEAGY